MLFYIYESLVLFVRCVVVNLFADLIMQEKGRLGDPLRIGNHLFCCFLKVFIGKKAC